MALLRLWSGKERPDGMLGLCGREWMAASMFGLVLCWDDVGRITATEGSRPPPTLSVSPVYLLAHLERN